MFRLLEEDIIFRLLARRGYIYINIYRERDRDRDRDRVRGIQTDRQTERPIDIQREGGICLFVF